jgi:3-oxoacyl-[acyl-carrier protein] reductase
MSRVQGKVAIITGAARGIGKATALLFAKEGAKVALCDILAEEGRYVEKEINEKFGEGRALFIESDVSKEDDVKSMVNDVIKHFGRIDILINNAGIIQHGTITDTDITIWEKIIKVNLTSAFLCCKYVVPYMIQKRSGSIVNVSSVLALRGAYNTLAYATSKAGLIGFTKSLAQDLMQHNIRVNAVAPRAIDTAMYRQYRTGDEIRIGLETGRYLFGRLGKPEEVAHAILFLASDEASYITGEVIVIGGFC